MNATQLKGKWKQLQGDLKQKWGKLTDDELVQIDGDTDKLVGKLQELYGYSEEEAQRHVENFGK